MSDPNLPSAIQEQISLARANISTDTVLAELACNKAIELAETAQSMAAEAEARHLYAQLLFTTGRNVDAVGQMRKALDMREALNDLPKVSVSLNSLGIILNEIGDFTTALDCCFRSLQIKEDLNDKRGIATTLINIGSIYFRLNNQQEELMMYERSLQIAVEIEDKRLIANNHLNLGLLHTKLHNYEKALQYLTGLDEQLIELGDSRNALSALNTQGWAFLGLKDYARSLDKYNRYLELSRETGNTSAISNALMNIAEVKLNMGQAPEAKPYIDEAIRLSENSGLRINVKDAKLILSDYYAGIEDYKRAFEEYKQHVALKDELLNAQNLKQLGELRLEYNLDKKDKEAKINYLKNVELKEALEHVELERDRSDKLLLNILPEEVAEELKLNGKANARYYESVSVMFIDIKNFTIISEKLSPEGIVAEIHELFSGFDKIIQQYDIEKIKTIGDAYMCASGLPVADTEHCFKMVLAAIDILKFVEELKVKKALQRQPAFDVRIGINSGPVVAGIVGISKFAYDIWGDTVNTAARMEQSGEVGRINVSGSSYALLKDKFTFDYRGKIGAKNKGEIDMYFLSQSA